MAQLIVFAEFTLAILALGEVLDRTLPTRIKTNTLIGIRRSGKSNQQSISGLRWVDNWMGRWLFSWRAFRKSVQVTLLSLILALLLATFPDTTVLRGVLSSMLSNSTIGAWVFAVSLLGAIAADYFSIIQTRIFARAIDSFRKTSISYLLCVADFFMSAAIFCVVLAFCRVVSYMIIAAVPNGTTIIQQSWVAPRIIREAFEPNVNSDQPAEGYANFRSSADQTVLEIMHNIGGQNQIDLSGVRTALRRAELPGTQSDFARYDVSLECFPGENALGRALLSSSVHDETYAVILRGIGERRRLTLTYAIRRYLDDASQLTSGHCNLTLLSVQRTYNAQAAIRDVGLLNAYLAAFSATLHNTFSSIGTKFSLYASPNVADEIRMFLINSWASKSTTWLGAGGDDLAAREISEQFRRADANTDLRAYIPFSTFAISAMAPSMVLFSAVIWQTISKIIIWLRRRFSLLFGTKGASHIFRSIAVSLSAIFALVLIASGIVNALWVLVHLII